MKASLQVRLLRLATFVLSTIHAYSGSLRVKAVFAMGAEHLYKPRPDDIFVVTFPKSGTTLLQMMLYQMTTDGSMDFQHIDSVSPWFELEFFKGKGNPARWEQMPSPRVFKSHFRYDRLPRTGRFIYVLRDPADVAVSAYHHFCMTTGMDLPQGRAIDQFINEDKAFFGSWFKHVESWWPHRNDPDVLFLRYEDVIADLEGTVRKVAAFCGIAVEEAAMPRILECCSVAFMKQHSAKFDPRLHQINRYRGEFIRKGRAGAGAEEMTAAQREKLEAKVQALFQRLGENGPAPLGPGVARPVTD